MVRPIWWLVAGAMLMPAPAAAQGEAAALTQARERGRMMFAYDRAAWLGTDDMLAKIADLESTVAGYIVEGSADAPRLIFFDRSPERKAVYVANFAAGKLVDGKVLSATDDRTITPVTQRMITALLTARRAITAVADARPCANAAFNTVVLPPAAPDAPVLVYFLTPQTDNEHIPFGGHFEIDVAADGTAGPIRRFTKSCLTMPTKPPAGARGAAVVVTQLIGALPTEIHVFTSLAIGVPVLVATGPTKLRMWPVNGDQIAAPDDLKK